MRKLSAPADAPDSEHLRAGYDREMRNMIAIMLGFVVGRAAPGVALFLWFGQRAGGVRPRMWLELAEQAAWLAVIVLFVRFVLPWFARRSYNEARQRRRTPARRRIERLALVSVLTIGVVGILIMAIFAGPAPLLMIGIPLLSGVSAALLWAGSRWRTGDDLHCARCNYPRSDAPPDRCPECGSPWLEPWRTTLGRRTVHRPLIIAGCITTLLLVLDIALAFTLIPVL